ncbi:hypothetical protein GCM10022198_08690 [Klugiella xanthotipulae]|uniref:Signal transduction histidine kinase n=1 Tax=Klugiella xanthotipulae TaxID=244735 RepID=A0A543HTH4_9MICO|nr:sensor histidine kinase [Klugiella xanthotipulae]TQM61590.1 signal transduction histidine kinase [Klugiella xanthotipulae]TQM65217.1 signal transduction histidine kinase [Klugiella xanthotipulae]
MSELLPEEIDLKYRADRMMHFEVHPSVLFKLGEDLITDDAQALVELVKNAYDADAQTVRIEIDTENWFDRVTGELVAPGAETHDGAVRGRLTVRDDGHGMDLDAIRDGWLTVSNSRKRAFKLAGHKTSAGRTPLGDKGLGRLGVQRLGGIVSLSTVPNGQPGGQVRHEVHIDWTKFAHADNLTSVSLPVSSLAAGVSEPGTTITVLGLANLAYWEGKGDLDLQKQLAAILSPYENAAGLRVFIKINHAEIDTRREAKRLLEAAPTILSFTYENGVFRIEGRTQVSALRGRSSEEQSNYRRILAPDNGFAFAEWLLRERASRSRAVGAELGDDKYFIRFSRTLTFNEAVEVGHLAGDPGPFAGEISSFNYNRTEDSALDSSSELREFARAIAGIRVFRDGFGIRLDDDWLGLSQQQTTASSYYGLRPLNSAGYVNITARENAALEETSSREAFRDTPAWRGFHDLMQQVVRFARETQELVRRNWNTYVREQNTPTEIDETASPSVISKHIADRASQVSLAKGRSAEVKKALVELEGTIASLEESQHDSSQAVWADPKLQAAVEKATSEIRDVQSKLTTTLANLDEIMATVRDLEGAAALLQEKVEVADERVSDAWDSVALGLSAEVLAHEVDQISDRLRGRSHQILDYLRKQNPVDTRTMAYAEHVRASAAELVRQVSRLNPALRFRRDTKSTHRVSALVASAIDYHGPRLAQKNIEITLMEERDFAIRINEGKFMQMIDNLIRNSEYWVDRDIKQKSLSKGEIVITVDLPRVRVRDNGPGVQPVIEDSLFDAFVTMKPSAEGRGLGLFVVGQLLDSEGATLGLSDHRNFNGRRDTFEIDLRALLADAETVNGGQN